MFENLVRPKGILRKENVLLACSIESQLVLCALIMINVILLFGHRTTFFVCVNYTL